MPDDPGDERLIGLLRAGADRPERRTEMRSRRSAPAAAPLDDAALARSVERLGFEPPPPLVLAYRRIANGGFGPGYGLLGLDGGFTDNRGRTAVDLYKRFVSDEAVPGWTWPRSLLPACDRGCGMYACVDCSSDPYPVVVFDSDTFDDACGLGGDPDAAFAPIRHGLRSWLHAWAGSGELWPWVRKGGER